MSYNPYKVLVQPKKKKKKLKQKDIFIENVKKNHKSKVKNAKKYNKSMPKRPCICGGGCK